MALTSIIFQCCSDANTAARNMGLTRMPRAVLELIPPTYLHVLVRLFIANRCVCLRKGRLFASAAERYRARYRCNNIFHAAFCKTVRLLVQQQHPATTETLLIHANLLTGVTQQYRSAGAAGATGTSAAPCDGRAMASSETPPTACRPCGVAKVSFLRLLAGMLLELASSDEALHSLLVAQPEWPELQALARFARTATALRAVQCALRRSLLCR